MTQIQDDPNGRRRFYRDFLEPLSLRIGVPVVALIAAGVILLGLVLLASLFR